MELHTPWVQCTSEKKVIHHMKTSVKSPRIHQLKQTAKKYPNLLQLSVVRSSKVELDGHLQHSAMSGMKS